MLVHEIICILPFENRLSVGSSLYNEVVYKLQSVTDITARTPFIGGLCPKVKVEEVEHARARWDFATRISWTDGAGRFVNGCLVAGRPLAGCTVRRAAICPDESEDPDGNEVGVRSQQLQLHRIIQAAANIRGEKHGIVTGIDSSIRQWPVALFHNYAAGTQYFTGRSVRSELPRMPNIELPNGDRCPALGQHIRQ